MEKLGKTLGLTTTGLLVVGGLTYAIVANAKYIQHVRAMHSVNNVNGEYTASHREGYAPSYLTESPKSFIRYWLNPPRVNRESVASEQMLFGLRGGRF